MASAAVPALRYLSECPDHPWFFEDAIYDLALLDTQHPTLFPSPDDALPDGLLALDGDLSLERLLAAYRQGIFPWYSFEPIKWWSPDPRSVFTTADLHINRSLRRALRGKSWRLTVDRDFSGVIHGCAEPRQDDDHTWLVPEMLVAYCKLHRTGHAHSVEVWEGERLVGGIYGVAVGKLFCGESMFSRESGASKLALVALGQLLAALGFPLLDSQVINPHTEALGAVEIPRSRYLAAVAQLTAQPSFVGSWAHFTERLIQPCAL